MNVNIRASRSVHKLKVGMCDHVSNSLSKSKSSVLLENEEDYSSPKWINKKM